MKELPVRMLLISKLLPSGYNPRTITPAALAALRVSLKTFGLVQPIVWNKRTGHVVGGHQRLAVLRADGCRRVQCTVVNLSLADEKTLNIALNNPAGAGTFDQAKLAAVLDEIAAARPAAARELNFNTLVEDLGLDERHTLEGRPFPPPPSPMTWILVGIPTVRFGEIAVVVEKIAARKGVVCEVTANNG